MKTPLIYFLAFCGVTSVKTELLEGGEYDY
jgi:hypothetical protein